MKKKAHKKRAPLTDSGSNLPTYLGLVFGTFFFDAAKPQGQIVVINGPFVFRLDLADFLPEGLIPIRTDTRKARGLPGGGAVWFKSGLSPV